MCVVVLFRCEVIRRGVGGRENKSGFKRFKQELLARVQIKKKNSS